LIATYVIALVGTLIDQWDKLAWVLALIGAGVIYYQFARHSRQSRLMRVG